MNKTSFGNLYGTSGTTFPDNTTGQISEGDMRDFGQAIKDSAMFIDDNLIDEDDMASDSSTKAPSQQSVKAYVDAQVGGAGITNSAVANELMKSNGTNAVASGIFSTASSNVSLGNASSTGGTRTITTGGTTTSGLTLTTNAGVPPNISLTSGGDVNVNSVTSTFTTSNGVTLIANSSSNTLTLKKNETNDDPTVQIWQSKITTTDATETNLLSVDVPASTAIGIRGVVMARRTGGSAGTAEDAAMYEIKGLYKNVAGTSTAIGTPSITVIGESQAGWDVQLDLSSNDVLINVTGAANNNITWHLSKLEVYPLSS